MAEQFSYLDAYDRAVAVRRNMLLCGLGLLGGRNLTLFDLIHLTGIVGGGWLGFTTGGRELGVAGLLGGILGLVVGHFVGIVPTFVGWAGFRLACRFSSIERLRRRLKKDYLMADFLIAEMIVRGEPAESFWPSVLSLLREDSFPKRHASWESLKLWFPRIAQEISGFTPDSQPEVCKRYVEKLENIEPSAAPLPRDFPGQGFIWLQYQQIVTAGGRNRTLRHLLSANVGESTS